MARVEVITGAKRRRHWIEYQKRAVIAASLILGAVVSDVARRPADVCPGQIYCWRKELGAAPAGFAEVRIAPAATPLGVALSRRSRSNLRKVRV